MKVVYQFFEDPGQVTKKSTTFLTELIWEQWIDLQNKILPISSKEILLINVHYNVLFSCFFVLIHGSTLCFLNTKENQDYDVTVPSILGPQHTHSNTTGNPFSRVKNEFWRK